MLDEQGRVLIAQRPAGTRMAGAWEFPGGKLAVGEDRLAGLGRELHEELGIHVDAARPLIRYRHRYADFTVDLDVWRVAKWRGTPQSCEGQALAWHLPEELSAIGLLPADEPVVRAIRLPEVIAVTPPAAARGEEAFLDALEAATASLLCLRRPELDTDALLRLAAGAACRIEETGVRLLLHGDPAILAPAIMNPPPALRARLGDAIAGLHVPARYLAGLSVRPLPAGYWFGASCHDAAELEAAHRVGADYAFLGPVKPTASHPGQPGLGWEAFAALVADRPLPVYGIGGLGPADLQAAWEAGAQGVAGIRGFRAPGRD
jgi:8-oxo-dGTP diphosphatase